MAQSQVSVLKLYRSVIEDVITGVRDCFLDEGVDEQVLQELKQIWETKLVSSKAVEPNPDPPEPQPPQLTQKDVNRVTTIAKAVHQSNMFSQHTAPLQQSQTSQQQMVTQTLSAVPPSQPSTTVIMTDPNKQVPIQITLPAQGGGDAQPRVLTIQVPASALQGNQLHQVLTGPVISATMALPPHLASTLLQQHVTAALQGQAAASTIHIQPSATPERQTYQSGAIRQLDGALEELHEEEPCQLGGGPCIQENIVRRLRGPLKSGSKVLQLEIPESSSSTVLEQSIVNKEAVHNIGHQLDGHEDTSDEDEDEDDDEDIDDDDDNDEKEDEENEEENNGGQEEEPLNSEDDVSDEDPSDLFDTDNVVVCQYDKITRSRNKWKFYLKDGIMNLNGKDFVFQKASGDAEW